jgi:peroxiredoxin
MAVTKVDSDDLADDRAAASTAAKKHGIDYPCLMDRDGAWMKAAGIQGLPSFVVVDRAGKLVYRYRGKLTPDGDGYRELSQAIEKTL